MKMKNIDTFKILSDKSPLNTEHIEETQEVQTMRLVFVEIQLPLSKVKQEVQKNEANWQKHSAN